MPPSSPRSPRPEVLAFLADVKEHPREDGLRLIFADWLEENGDPLDQLRAELIRSQIEHFRQPPTSASRPEHGRLARAPADEIRQGLAGAAGVVVEQLVAPAAACCRSV